MSDTPQGPGWWQASDDKWYPPPRPDMPGDEPTQQQPPEAPPTSPYDSGPPMGGPPGGPPGYPPSSPYGGMPMQPPPNQGNRTALFVLLGGVGAAVLVGLIFLIVSGDDDGSEETQTSNTSELPPEDDNGTTTTGGDNPTTTTTDGGGTDDPPPSNEGGGDLSEGGSHWYVSDSVDLGDDLMVTEYGWSNIEDGTGEIFASYGLIVENTGSEVREQVGIRINGQNEEGTTVESDDETVYSIQPGQKVGLGGQFGGGFGGSGQEIVDFEIVPQGAGSGYSDPGSGDFTISDVNASASGGYSTDVTFQVESSYGQQLDDTMSTAILRNSSGEIISGNRSISALSFVPEDGKVGGDISIFATFEELDVDLEQTEVYVEHWP